MNELCSLAGRQESQCRPQPRPWTSPATSLQRVAISSIGPGKGPNGRASDRYWPSFCRAGYRAGWPRCALSLWCTLSATGCKTWRQTAARWGAFDLPHESSTATRQAYPARSLQRVAIFSIGEGRGLNGRSCPHSPGSSPGLGPLMAFVLSCRI